MVLGYKIEVNNGKERKEVYINKGLFHKIDVEASKELSCNQIPNWFMRWVGKDELESYLAWKKKEGFRINFPNKLNSNADKTCATKHVIPPKSKIDRGDMFTGNVLTQVPSEHCCNCGLTKKELGFVLVGRQGTKC